MSSLPLHRLNDFVTLDRNDVDTFGRLASERWRFTRHDVIRGQGQPSDNIFFLVEGWVACCVQSAAGGEQIVKVHLPGDILGAPSLALTKTAESLVALTRTTVDVIPAERIGELFATSPRISAALFLAAQQERICLMDRLTSLGRTSAVERLAAFLDSVHQRLCAIDPKTCNRFELPLSQKELANVLGITTVHANRTLLQIEKTGLISRSGRWITIEDVEELRRFSCLPQREYQRKPDWLGVLSQDTSSEPVAA